MSSFSLVLKSKIDEDLAYSVQCVLYDVTAIKRYWGLSLAFSSIWSASIQSQIVQTCDKGYTLPD